MFELNLVEQLVVGRQERAMGLGPVTFLGQIARNIRKHLGKKWNFQTKHLISCHSRANLFGKTVHTWFSIYKNLNRKIIGTNAEMWEMVQNFSFRLWFTYEKKSAARTNRRSFYVQPGENKLIDCHFQYIDTLICFYVRSTDCSVVLVYKLSPFSYNWKWWCYSG